MESPWRTHRVWLLLLQELQDLRLEGPDAPAHLADVVDANLSAWGFTMRLVSETVAQVPRQDERRKHNAEVPAGQASRVATVTWEGPLAALTALVQEERMERDRQGEEIERIRGQLEQVRKALVSGRPGGGAAPAGMTRMETRVVELEARVEELISRVDEQLLP